MKKIKVTNEISIWIVSLFIIILLGTEPSFSLKDAITTELIISIHMSYFVLIPLAKIISKDNSTNIFLSLFVIRAVALLFCDMFITPNIAWVDILILIIVGFILSIHKDGILSNIINQKISDIGLDDTDNNDSFICSKCGKQADKNDKFCKYCGAELKEETIVKKNLVKITDFDPMFKNDEDKLLELIINKEIAKAKINKDNSLIPIAVLQKKNILNILFCLLVFVYVGLIFFHFPIYTYIIGIILLIFFFRMTRKYDLIQYLKKEIKARPSEKISNIVMNIENSCIKDKYKSFRIVCIIIAIILPLIIFRTPKIMYEKIDGGYSVRFYTFGLTNFETATIPSTYKGEKVISLRGNTFSNMPFLTSINLPDTITEIRGQAFKNDINLVNINIPNKLKYLGGGAFYNCSSIEVITLPDTLTYMGGESFYKASSLEYIRLSQNLSEIRGDSFEYCTSLKKIIIPDNITRIGGHAFYGDTLLSEVVFSENSKLEEIGSSAFRQCYSLYNITIPYNTYVNERAFKESPTSIKYFNSYEYENYSSNY